ncbi:MAG: hypothetical protein M3044_06980 [Thermoproteota archaeon]|nr:hypothetical protein [Thermoproteota archaeon]
MPLFRILASSCLAAITFEEQQTPVAQQFIQTVKYRNLVMDLGNGVKTNAQLTLPTVGKGPFPRVLLVHGSCALDKNETLGFTHLIHQHRFGR